jgi:hypothetical protein
VLVPLGTVNVAEKVPVAVLVNDAGFVVTVVLSSFIVIALLALKLDPETVTGVLGWVALGESVIVAGMITLKDADDVFAALSVAVIV